MMNSSLSHHLICLLRLLPVPIKEEASTSHESESELLLSRSTWSSTPAATSTGFSVTLALTVTPKQIQFSTLQLPQLIPLSPAIHLSALRSSSPAADLHLNSVFTKSITVTDLSPPAISSPNPSHSELPLPESHSDAATTTKASSSARRGFSD
ncbi:hypothetical protein LINPERHAP2_LOCUS32467 [Linum perenne]